MGLQPPPTTTGRTQFEVKQDTQVNNQITVLPPVKYETPRIESNFVASIQVPQYQPPASSLSFIFFLTVSVCCVFVD